MEAEEKEKFIQWVGVEEAKTLEEAKDKFVEDYLEQTKHKEIIGKTLYSVSDNMRKSLGLSHSEIKDKKIEEVVSEKFTALKTEYESLKEELEKGSPDVAKLKGDLEKYQLKETEWKTKQTEFEAEKNNLLADFANKEKGWNINSELKEIEKKLPFSETADDYTKIGFHTVFRTKYDFDLDENKKLIVKTKEGKPVEDPTKKGVYLQPLDVFDLELEKANLKKKNAATNNNFVFKPAKPDEPDNSTVVNTATRSRFKTA